MVRLVYDSPWGSSSLFVKSGLSWALGYGGLCHEAQKVGHTLGRKVSLYAVSFIGSFEKPSLCSVLPWVRLSCFQVTRNILSFIHWGFHFWVHIWISKSYVCLLNVPFSNSMLLFHGMLSYPLKILLRQVFLSLSLSFFPVCLFWPQSSIQKNVIKYLVMTFLIHVSVGCTGPSWLHVGFL